MQIIITFPLGFFFKYSTKKNVCVMIHKTRAVISGLRKKTVPLKMVRYKDRSKETTTVQR